MISVSSPSRHGGMCSETDVERNRASTSAHTVSQLRSYQPQRDGANSSAGRLAYFYSTTSPLTLLASSAKLEDAQKDVKKYEGLIKDAGREGCWVDAQDRDRYYEARQRG